MANAVTGFDLRTGPWSAPFGTLLGANDGPNYVGHFWADPEKRKMIRVDAKQRDISAAVLGAEAGFTTLRLVDGRTIVATRDFQYGERNVWEVVTYHLMVDGPTHDVWVECDPGASAAAILNFSRGAYKNREEVDAAYHAEVAKCEGRRCYSHNPDGQ